MQLLLPQSAGVDERANVTYHTRLTDYAKHLGVEVRYIGDRVVADSVYRGEPNHIPFYSLYHAADLIMFPSYQEGFGNQFLEAVALGKGVVSCHAYPVMKADILPRIDPEGVILLGSNSDYILDANGLVHLREDVLQAAVEREIHFLLHPNEEQRVAARTYQRLKEAFEATVVGTQLSALLQKSFPSEDLSCDCQKEVA